MKQNHSPSYMNSRLNSVWLPTVASTQRNNISGMLVLRPTPLGVTPSDDVGQVAMPREKLAGQMLDTPELPNIHKDHPKPHVSCQKPPLPKSRAFCSFTCRGMTSVDRTYSVFNNRFGSPGGILKLHICTAGGDICRGKSFGVQGAQRQRLTHELPKAAETA